MEAVELLAAGSAEDEARSEAELTIAAFLAGHPEPQSELGLRLVRLLSFETRIVLSQCGSAEIRGLLADARLLQS